MSRASGSPAAISSWMCAVCEKRNGQKANRTAAVAADHPSPVSRRAVSHIVTTVAANENSTTTLCAVSAFRVSHHTGRAMTPDTRLASENAKAFL